MRPVCLLLPVESDLARGVWTLLELGFQESRVGKGPSRSAGPRVGVADKARRSPESPDHLRILASLVRDHLIGDNSLRGEIWMEHRELGDFLRLLECGLGCLDAMPPHSVLNCPELKASVLESVADLLDQIRAHLGTARKPVQRQTTPRVRAASAAG